MQQNFTFWFIKKTNLKDEVYKTNKLQGQFIQLNSFFFSHFFFYLVWKLNPNNPTTLELLFTKLDRFSSQQTNKLAIDGNNIQMEKTTWRWRTVAWSSIQTFRVEKVSISIFSFHPRNHCHFSSCLPSF